MKTSSNRDVTWLKLPRRKPFNWSSVSAQYGACHVAAEHCCLSNVPDLTCGHWSHGWIPTEHQVDPRIVISYLNDYKKFWVARNDEAEYLQQHGFDARAIGLPIAYTRAERLVRKPGSLLVLPPHSLPGEKGKWKEKELAAYVNEIAAEFSYVTACVHQACFDNGLWIKTFEEAGIPVVAGASNLDSNSLQRTRDLFSQFEFVTSNGFGSGLAYAAAFGAKVSISGPFAPCEVSNYRWNSWYQNNPGLIQKVHELTTEEALRRRWPQLFVQPQDATENSEWGQDQIGTSNLLSAQEMCNEFAWGANTQTKYGIKTRVKTVIRSTVPKPIRTWVAESRRGPDPNETKWAPLAANPELRQLEIDGRQFHFTQPETFRGTYKHIFERDFYRIPVVIEQPTILDCGANIGLATRYWLEKYPKARIIAFEPDPQLFQVLEKNCNEVPDANVDLCCAAVWNENTTLSFASTGMETGALQDSVEIPDGESIDVKAVDLSDFLQERVDFLKLDIEGAECDVIPSLDGKLDHVMAMYIEYHSYDGQPQRLADIFKTLENNGFRHAINTNFASQQPMRQIESSYGMDMRLDIWAWK